MAVLLCAALAAAVLGREPGFVPYRAVQESLARMPARYRAEWLQKHGLDASRYTEYHKPESASTGLKLVGKYGRGESNAVTGRGSLVALTLGSEVALLNFAKPDSPVVLSEIQLDFTPAQSALHDSFLLTCGNGIEIWNIVDSTHPVYRNVIPYAVGDFAIFDTFLYFASSGTFYSYSIANTANPRPLGTCAENGGVTAATKKVVVAKEPGGLAFIDVSNPAAPERVGTYGIGALGVDARGNICVANGYQNGDQDRLWVDVLDISDPTNPRLLGEVDSVGGYDVHLSGPLAFTSGYYYGWGFAIIDISDSTRPHDVSQIKTPNDGFAVWADWTSNHAYVADAMGLAVMDIHDINHPVYDTTVLPAHDAWDVWLDGCRAYVADGGAGLRILDVTNPANPIDLGGIDTANIHAFETRSAVGQDSFAFMSWSQPPPLRTIDVTDPARPSMAGACSLFDPPKDMVLRDSFLYCAEAYRFQVVNVARPRQPVLVGSCVLQNDVMDLWLKDSLAYVSSVPSYIINVANPTNPFIVGNISSGTYGIAVIRDTYAVTTPGYDSIVVYNVSVPSVPYPIASLALSGGHQGVYDVELMDDTLAAVSGNYVHLVNVRDPLSPREVCRWSTPSGGSPHLSYVAPYLYVACSDAGVCVLETTATGVAEPKQVESVRTRKGATVVRGVLMIGDRGQKTGDRAELLDVSGRKVMDLKPGANDVRALAPGVYFVREAQAQAQAVRKVVLTGRR